MAGQINVEVAYATVDQQAVRQLTVADDALVAEAVEISGLLARFPEIPWPAVPIGIFGRKVTADTRLSEGDRVEIYRPLRVDPKTRRRERAQGG